MKYQPFFILAAVLFMGCNNSQPTRDVGIIKKQQDTADNYATGLKQKESEYQNKSYDNHGQLLFKVEFKVKAEKEDLAVFKDGIIPWISIEAPEKQMKRLIDADKIVLPYKEVFVTIDYPLKVILVYGLASQGGGFTKRQIINMISELYKKIYKEEEESATVKTVPKNGRKGLINRNETNGKYGIWGHDLGDLDLSAIEVFRSTDGKICLSLDVES